MTSGRDMSHAERAKRTGRVLVQAYLSAEAAEALDAMGGTRTATLERLVLAEAKRMAQRKK